MLISEQLPTFTFSSCPPKKVCCSTLPVGSKVLLLFCCGMMSKMYRVYFWLNIVQMNLSSFLTIIIHICNTGSSQIVLRQNNKNKGKHSNNQNSNFKSDSMITNNRFLVRSDSQKIVHLILIFHHKIITPVSHSLTCTRELACHSIIQLLLHLSQVSPQWP